MYRKKRQITALHLTNKIITELYIQESTKVSEFHFNEKFNSATYIQIVKDKCRCSLNV